MNVGNYTDSILEALGASKEFGGGVAGLTSAFEGLNPILARCNKRLSAVHHGQKKQDQKQKQQANLSAGQEKAFVGLAVSAGALAGGALTLLATAFAKSRAGGEQLAVIQQKIKHVIRRYSK